MKPQTPMPKERTLEADRALRQQIAAYLDWQEAHASFDAAVADIPAAHMGVQPDGLPHSAWQLLEHIRRTQADILDFCSNPGYVERTWPVDFWPAKAAPTSPAEWNASVAAFRRDREALQRICFDPAIDLFAAIPHGDGQTYLREMLLVTDHTAYHVGQLVMVRRRLGDWQPA